MCPTPSGAAFCQAWEQLEKAEHERELALRNELIRQEKLELLAQRFDHKAAMRETWLNENQRLVSQVGGLNGDPPHTGKKRGRDTWFWMLGGVGVLGENGGTGVGGFLVGTPRAKVMPRVGDGQS